MTSAWLDKVRAAISSQPEECKSWFSPTGCTTLVGILPEVWVLIPATRASPRYPST